MDVTAAVRKLRRSISRSPSKFLTRNASQDPDNLQQASPQCSPCRASEGIEKSRHISQLESGATQLALLKALEAAVDPSMVAAIGALKRSDATMNLDQPNQGSPVAKRRSVNSIAGASQADDTNIFGAHSTASQSFSILEDSLSDYELFPMQQAADSAPTPATNIPKRSSSLRKSTLQQRYGEKTSWGKRSGDRQLAQLGSDPQTP
ncbi:hypothetical protein ESCO_003536 [Escovopsis weberi]|uniref:Uncharacterized protein n=1 Tax=Escovopsis weberi TaxID=150374 RepID=A0A0M8MZY0_ESCWE|nr:hypothetical protein ESCO_003536 [Escovopsis weberi]